MRAKLLLLILLVLAPFTVVDAQDKPRCDPAGLIAELASLKSTGDEAKDMTVLVGMRDEITAQNVACNGYIYEGSGSSVIKPFDLPEGLYTLRVTSGPGQMIVSTRSVSGDCKSESSLVLDMSMSDDIETEALLESTGCKLILEIEYTALGRRDWTLTIEPL